VSAESQPPTGASSRPPLQIAPEPNETDETAELRDAVAQLHDTAAQAQARAAIRQGIAERVPGSMPVTYVGLISRGIAFAVDAAIINLVALVVALAAALIVSVFRVPHQIVVIIAAIGAVVYVLWTITYFVAFWSGTGQTPGARLMDFRVVTSDYERVHIRRAIVRWFWVQVAALPLFLGFTPIIFDRRCRGLPDYLARTLVVEAPSVVITPHGRRLRDRGTP